MTKEALKLALKTLEYAGPSWIDARQPAITAIKEVLAQPEHIGFMDSKLNPLQRTWIGLTDEEIKNACDKHTNWFAIALDLEAKLKEKNT